MSIIRIVEGEMINTTTGKMDLRATDGDYVIHAAGKNRWHGNEEGIYEKNYEPLDPDDSLDNTVTVTLNIFFDGTQNNKTNTAEGKDHKKSNHLDDSYTNDYTNIARGYDAIDPNAIFQKALYIEGIGTEDLQKDDVFPDVAVGMGSRGVVAKVVKACLKAPTELKEYKYKRIDVLKINVYGFSRGAAAARHFLHIATTPALIHDNLPNNKVQVLAPGYYDGMEDGDAMFVVSNCLLLENHGFFAACLLRDKFKIYKIEFNFIGLYDTVASHGVYHGNDVEDLQLKAIQKATFVLQLSSDDEYRENFDLTNIQSAGLHGLELTLPGVHSDIGGSYINEAVEKSVLYYKKKSLYSKMILHSDEEIEKFKEIVINEGWFSKRQLKSGTFQKHELNRYIYEHSAEGKEPFYALVGTRQLYNTYDQIPLHFMFHFSQDRKVEYDQKYIDENHSIQDGFIRTVKNNLNRYVNACNDLRNSYIEMYKGDLYDKTSLNHDYLYKLKKIAYWDYLDLESTQKLRNQYLHWSVKANEIGLGARESQAPSKEGALLEKYRKREIHNG